MKSEPSNSDSLQDPQLQALLVSCLEQLQQGESPDLDHLVQKYPQHEQTIKAFLSDQKLLKRLAGELREPLSDVLRVANDSEATVAPGTARTDVSIGDQIRYIGEYEILEEIARGGMGVVFKARQQGLNRIVALKMILSGTLADESDVERFQREAKAAGRLQHANIVSVHEIGRHDGHHYFTMDYVQGRSLAEMIRDRSLQPRKACQLIKTLAEAVEFAHQHDVLHRDLKPANVLIDADLQPNITDFGLAKVIADKEETPAELTESGQILGTPSYMSPEQAAGRHEDVGPATDIYGLGAILYACLTGRGPFVGESSVDTLMQVISDEPVPPRSLATKVPKDLNTICLQCLAKDPSKRYRTAQHLADDLERHLQGRPVAARPIGRVPRTVRWCRRNPWPSIAGVTMVLLLVVAIGAAISLRSRYGDSLIERARTEHLAGNRAAAIDLISRAAAIKDPDEIRTTAIEAVASPGLRLKYQWPCNGAPPLKFSPDGSLLAALAKSGRHIDFWDLNTGLLAFSSRPDWDCNECLFSPVGRVVALWNSTMAGSGEMIIWTLGQNRTTHRLSGTPMAFSPDGKRLAIKSGRHRVKVIETLTGALLPHEIEGVAIQFVSNEQLYVQSQGRVISWNVLSGNKEFLTPDDKPVVKVSPDGKIAALVDGPITDNKTAPGICFWSLAENEWLHRLPGSGPARYSKLLEIDAMFDARANRLVYRDFIDPGLYRIWNLVGTNFNPTPNAFASIAHGPPAISPDGKLAAVTQKNTTSVTNIQTLRQITSLPDNAAGVWSPDGHRLATIGPVSIGPDGSFQRHSVRSFANVWEVDRMTETHPAGSAVTCLSVDRRGKRIGVNGDIWTIERGPHGNVLAPLEQTEATVATFIADDSRVWHANPRAVERKTGKPLPGPVWNDQSNTPILSLPKPERIRDSLVAFSPTGDWLVTNRSYESMAAQYLETWNLQSGERRTSSRLADSDDRKVVYTGLRFSPDGSLLAGDSRGGLRVWSFVRGELLHDFHVADDRDGNASGAAPSSPNRIAFAPNGKRIYSGRSRGQLCVFSLVDGGESEIWSVHMGPVSSLAVDPSGKTVASGSHDGNLVLSNASGGKTLARWRAHDAGVTALAFSHDGELLISGGSDGMVSLWDLPRIRAELTALGMDW